MEAKVQWLTPAGDLDALLSGASFGMPWPKNLYRTGQTFVIRGGGQEWPLASQEIAFWPDGSLKWTAHSVSGNIDHCESYVVKAGEVDKRVAVVVDGSAESLHVVNDHRLGVRFANPGSPSLLEEVSLKGQVICSGATVIASVDNAVYSTVVKKVQIENATSDRAVVKVSGVVVSSEGQEHLPFDVRVCIYSNAPTVKIVHTFIHDLEASKALTSLGIRFSVPLKGAELYNRHIRLGGSNGGILKEEVQGLSGLRFGPTVKNRIDQTAGKPVDLKEEAWEKTDVRRGLSYIPSWSDYTLSQLSSDGFTIKKRTKEGHSWVKVNAGTRADGIAYVGSARTGGLAVGMSDFWERYPTQLDLNNLTIHEGTITIWLYSPLAEPLETMPYHDGLGMDTYAKQLEGLNVTYEDYEPGFATANGIARTNIIYLRPYETTPSNAELRNFSSSVRNPPRLIPNLEYMHSTGVFHGCWAPDHHVLNYSPSEKEETIEKNLEFLFSFYQGQVEQHRWYGFWDYGDVQHTYDTYRHAWRYDVGGFAWDNSELSTDLWLWLYFLHTGRSDVFKMAEAMTRHTGEVDVYHSGRFKGFGTRHGVQHWSDSSKQLRISNVLFRRIYYYLTGDERTGDLISELQDSQLALLGLDSHRKVQEHSGIPEGFAMANIGLDCGPLAAAWLSAWERRTEGWVRARDLLIKMLEGISNLTHGVGNNAVLLNPSTGEIRGCPPPTPRYAISHLSMLFGFPEIFTELLDYAKDEYPAVVAEFMKVWLSYCRAYNGGSEIQLNEYGFEFPASAGWRQSHSTITAFAAVKEMSDELATAAWDQFFSGAGFGNNSGGYDNSHDWTVTKAVAPEYFNDGQEASWITTNEAARYGVSALFNLANIRRYI
ncbi:hypothetical protein TruAng_005344 [Truncatella angustata]|nr:hypothetical protein TruAng_005344 [Truncatella angustata]